MYYVMRASAPSLHRESTDSLIYIYIYNIYIIIYIRHYKIECLHCIYTLYVHTFIKIPTS